MMKSFCALFFIALILISGKIWLQEKNDSPSIETIEDTFKEVIRGPSSVLYSAHEALYGMLT